MTTIGMRVYQLEKANQSEKHKDAHSGITRDELNHAISDLKNHCSGLTDRLRKDIDNMEVS
jgi:hypothetical protein